MKRPAYTPSRSELRLGDLKQRRPTTSKLMNVKVPAPVFDQITRLGRAIGASKTEVVVALLNEGLAAAEKRMSRKLVKGK